VVCVMSSRPAPRGSSQLVPWSTSTGSRGLSNLVRAGEHVATHARHLPHRGRPGPSHRAPVALGALMGDSRAMLRNAADAIASQRGRSPIIRIKVRKGSGPSTVFCAVIDNGPGSPPGQLERIFEPYFTTRDPDQDTGLGLPVVRQFIEDLGGELQVESAVGDGTMSWLELSRTTEDHSILT
jgi:hypothetical protein